MSDPERARREYQREGALLGGLLLDPGRLTEVRGTGLVQSDFAGPELGDIYGAMCALADAREPVTTIAVVDHLRRGGVTSLLPSTLESRALMQVTPAAVLGDARSVLRRSRCDRIRRVCEVAIRRADRLEDPAEIAALLEEHTRPDRTDGQDTTWRDQVGGALERLYAERPRGLPCGMYALDGWMRPLIPGEVTIVAGRPGMGKSSFALQVALQVARDQGLAVGVLTHEMTPEQLAERAVLGYSGVSASDVRTHGAQLAAGASELSQLPVHVRKCAGASLPRVRAEIRRLVTGEGVGFVVVDYLQLIRSEVRTDSQNVRVSDISAGLKAAALDYEIPLLAVSQLSRDVEKRQNRRPIISDLRDSGSLEQDAAVILLLYRPEYYTRAATPEDLKGVLEVEVAKNRFGRTGTAKMRWHEETTWISEMDDNVRRAS